MFLIYLSWVILHLHHSYQAIRFTCGKSFLVFIDDHLPMNKFIDELSLCSNYLSIYYSSSAGQMIGWSLR